MSYGQIGQRPHPTYHRVQQRAENPRSQRLKLLPEEMLVASRLRLDIMKVYDERSVEKVRARSTEIRDRIENQGSGVVEHGCVKVAVELAPAEAAAGSEPTCCIRQILREMTKIIEADQPRVA